MALVFEGKTLDWWFHNGTFGEWLRIPEEMRMRFPIPDPFAPVETEEEVIPDTPVLEERSSVVLAEVEVGKMMMDYHCEAVVLSSQIVGFSAKPIDDLDVTQIDYGDRKIETIVNGANPFSLRDSIKVVPYKDDYGDSCEDYARVVNKEDSDKLVAGLHRAYYASSLNDKAVILSYVCERLGIGCSSIRVTDLDKSIVGEVYSDRLAYLAMRSHLAVFMLKGKDYQFCRIEGVFGYSSLAGWHKIIGYDGVNDSACSRESMRMYYFDPGYRVKWLQMILKEIFGLQVRSNELRLFVA